MTTMLRRPPTALALTAEDIAASEDRVAERKAHADAQHLA